MKTLCYLSDEFSGSGQKLTDISLQVQRKVIFNFSYTCLTIGCWALYHHLYLQYQDANDELVIVVEGLYFVMLWGRTVGGRVNPEA